MSRWKVQRTNFWSDPGTPLNGENFSALFFLCRCKLPSSKRNASADILLIGVCPPPNSNHGDHVRLYSRSHLKPKPPKASSGWILWYWEDLGKRQFCCGQTCQAQSNQNAGGCEIVSPCLIEKINHDTLGDGTQWN